MAENQAAPTKRPGRNEPCHCGSGKKYKQCCLAKDEEADRAARAKAAAEAAAAPDSEEHADHTQRTQPPKRPANQPWKRSTKNMGGFHKVSGPRKIGSS